ncbi:MAG: acetyl-CoA carboxylase biotin carboxylase subunit, partial [Marinilabiliaceae bacterium]
MSYRHIQTLFIANRGEIALRIIQTAQKLGMRTILPVIKDEISTLPAQEADEVVVLDDHSPFGNYLNPELMINLAREAGSDAIHPGYGFLSENAGFARQVEEAGLIWIGPSPDAIEKMGDKLQARKIAQNAGVSISRAIEGTPEEIIQHIDQLSFPLLIKAAAGGGGKAMQIARHVSELKPLLDQASREAQRYFGNPAIFVEEYIHEPRHIEVQILGDRHGNLVHLFERECSIQRRYQKIIEEAPSPFVTADLREILTRDALRLCREIGYFNAGTVEFLVDSRGQHYFLEMNTRLQVEHPVTEAITGIDLVEKQLQVAMGLPLDISQDQLKMNGHAIETRLYAEDARKDFSPSPGTIHFVRWPEKNRARCDTFFSEKTEILPDFDPMLAKIIAHGQTREAARKKLLSALEETSIVGITTNLPYLRHLIKTRNFIDGETNTHFAQKHNEILQQAIHPNGAEKTRLLMAAYAVWITFYRESGTNIWTKLGHIRWNEHHNVLSEENEHEIQIRDFQNKNKMDWSLNGSEMP